MSVFLENFIKLCEARVLNNVIVNHLKIDDALDNHIHEMEILPTKDNPKMKSLHFKGDFIGFLTYDIVYFEESQSNVLTIKFIPDILAPK